MKHKQILFAVLVVFLIVPALSGCSLSGAKPQYDKDNNPIFVSDTKLEDIYTDTKQYYGQFVTLLGVVTEAPQAEGSGFSFKMSAVLDSDSQDTSIFTKEDPGVQAGDGIKVTGYVYSVKDVKNAAGQSVRLPVVYGQTIVSATWDEIYGPVLAAFSFADAYIDMDGYRIAVTKVEFAQRETRVYVTASNGGTSPFTVYAQSAVLTQNGTQYAVVSVRDEFSDLAPGLSGSAALIFPAVDAANFKLYIDANADHDQMDIGDYEFDLTVQ
jgi:hypothetical protein